MEKKSINLHVVVPFIPFHLIRPNKKIPVSRVTQPYLNLLANLDSFFRFSKCIKKSRKKIIKKNECVPTLPKIFRPVSLNTFNFIFGLDAL